MEEIFTLDNDRPLINKSQDVLFIVPRKVDKVANLIEESNESAYTIAITGDWGVGKSSVLNLIEEKLHNDSKSDLKYIIVKFEPLLEGCFETRDLILLFLKKILLTLKNSQHYKPSKSQWVKNAIYSFLLFIKKNPHAQDFIGAAKEVTPIIKLIFKALEGFSRRDCEPLSSQLQRLDAELNKRNYRVLVVIDEIGCCLYIM